MDNSLSPISQRGHHRLHDDHLSISEQASPGKQLIDDDRPTDAIKFMVALLSLENTMLRIDHRLKDLAAGMRGIQAVDTQAHGDADDVYRQMALDLQYYQAKAMKLEVEVGKMKAKDDSVKAVAGREGGGRGGAAAGVIEQYHDRGGVDQTVLMRNQAYYDKKVYDVRNRSLLFHSIVRWLDLSRITNIDSDMKQTLAYMAFSKWKLKASYKVYNS